MGLTLSIVSGTYNRLALLQQMIQSARDQLPKGINYEFVMVDGGSTDGTLEWLRVQSDVRLVEHGELRGAIPAFTEGAFLASGKYVCLANDDVAFRPGSLLRAIVHLESVPRCGAVAFADNRPVQSGVKRGHAVMQIWAQGARGGYGVNYAQVGLFRKWLGDHIGWWYGHGAMEGARVYGGDSYLSARIWELGYTVDAVPEVMIDDFIADDNLRHQNGKSGGEDSQMYHNNYPSGVVVAPEPALPNQDERQLRVLYLPIYEPGHPIQHAQKHGLRDALAKRYLVYELDYLASGANLKHDLLRIAHDFQPNVLLTQLHGADQVTPAMLQEIRVFAPGIVIINWNGDWWEQGLTSPAVLELLKHVDLQLTVNGDVLPFYAERGIAAAYWQIAFEPVNETQLPDVPAHDLVFLGNAYSEARKQFEQVLLEVAGAHGFNLGVYGGGWETNIGETLYDFAKGSALYRNAKIALGDNQFGDTHGFVSNRLFEALAAGGALLLHQRVAGLEELTGITAGTHYIEWLNHDDLREKIVYWLDTKHEKQRHKIVAAGRDYARTHHSFAARVQQLFIGENALLKKARRELRDTITLEYLGSGCEQFGLMGVSGKHYTCTPGTLLTVDALDAPLILQGQFRKIGGVGGDTLAKAVERVGG